MKKTVKQKALEYVAKNGLVTRKQLVIAIRKINGQGAEYKQGYYSDGILSWMQDNLLERPEKGLYKITKLGEAYIKDPKHGNLLVRVANAERREKQYYDLFRKYQMEATEYKFTLDKIRTALNR